MAAERVADLMSRRHDVNMDLHPVVVADFLNTHQVSSECSANSNCDDGSPPPVRRMLFVTAAPALCFRVKQQFDRLKVGNLKENHAL